MIHPQALQPGDRVAVLSPAGPVIPSNLEAGLQILREWQLEPVVFPSVYARFPEQGYLAGDDRARAHDLHAALLDPSIAAIFCSRGGYGTMRLLPLLDTEIIRNNPKLLIGFSDITALHLYFSGILNIASIHGPVVKSLPLHHDDPHNSLQHLHDAIFGIRSIPHTIDTTTDGLRCVRAGKARGRLFGGNLCLVASMLSTDYCPDLTGAILVLEEIGEVDYRVDRLFTTLRLSPKTRNIAGIILGDFSQCSGVYVDDPDVPQFIEQLASEFGCPVVADFPTGHRSRNVALPIGCDVQIDANPNHSSVTFFDDAATASTPRPANS